MSLALREARSFEPINRTDLVQLARVASQEIMHVCREENVSRVYRNRLLMLCLCQGAALHYQQVQANVPRSEQQGVQDFDVWAFFREHGDGPFPPRWRGKVDFGSPKFGQSPGDTGFKGRRVDVMGRSIAVPQRETDIDAVKAWIYSDNQSPKEIRQRPVFVISMGENFGRQIWPED